MVLSPEEKIFLVHSAEHNIRTDGRRRLQYRPVEIETGVIPSGMGSARVTSGGTDLVVSIKATTCTPCKSRPNEGKFEFTVRAANVASPDFEGRKSEQYSDQITTMMNRLYSSISLHQFCIVPELKAWKIHLDVDILSIDGLLYDTMSFAVKAALATASIPKIMTSNDDKGQFEFTLTDDPSDVWTPNVSSFPILVTLSKIGDSIIIDATKSEEQCCSYAAVFAVAPCGTVLSTLKIGPGSVQPNTFITLSAQAQQAARYLSKELDSIIARGKDSKEDILGYLN